MRLLSSLLLLGVLASGCAPTSAPAVPSPEAPTGVPSPITGPEWRLAEIRSASGVTLSLDAGAPYSLTFGAGGRYSGQADCNRLGGAFEAAPDGTLRLSESLSTLVGCPAGSADDAFLKVLNAADGYRLDGRRLVLGGPAGALTLFRADAPDFGGIPPQETGRDYTYACLSPGAPFSFRTRTGPGEIALWLPARFDGRAGGTYRVLGQVRAASGVKYEDGPVTLWTHGLTEARLEVDGEAFTCTQTP